MANKNNKVSDVAKDLNVQNKDIINLLSQYFDGDLRKSGSALKEQELNLIIL